MNRVVYGKCIQGASHVRKDVVCQDHFKKVKYSDDIVILAVADGHGSDSCPYSHNGSRIAVRAFCTIMSNLLDNFNQDLNFLSTYLNREGEIKVAQMIDTKWKANVKKTHEHEKRKFPRDEKGEVDEAALYKQYGSTLLGLLVTPSFIFAFQLGDGDIVYVDKDGVTPVIEGDKILGTETYSLSKIDAWKKAITMIRMKDIGEELPCLYMMSTDGFANSYSSHQEFVKTCADYYTVIKENGFNAIEENLGDWLAETSEFGCGDDITVLMSYFD